jgi:hypothetical protein
VCGLRSLSALALDLQCVPQLCSAGVRHLHALNGRGKVVLMLLLSRS